MDTLKGREPYPHIDIQGGFYGVWRTRLKNDEEIEKFEPVGRACFVWKVFTQIETGEEYIKLIFNRTTHVFSRGEVYSRNPDELLKAGVDAQISHLTPLHQLFQKMELTADTGYCHRGLGWCQNPDTGGGAFRTDVLVVGEDDMPSTYIGGYKVAPTGDNEVWYGLIRKYCGYTPLAFIIAAGLSSVLVGYLNMNNVEVNNPIIHLSGKSSTGKTTAGMLFLSTAASPRTDSGLY